MFLASATGCLWGSLQDIPCDEDLACEPEGFCDLPRGVCHELTQNGGAPDVQVVGVVHEGALVHDVFVTAEITTPLRLSVRNRGGVEARDISVRLGQVVCLSANVEEPTIPRRLAPLELAEVHLSVTPRSCSAVVIEDWFASFSGRESRGTFNIVVQPAVSDDAPASHERDF
jgi:hypothetical protein